MKVPKDLFARGNRMILKFEDLLDRNDPLGNQTFDMPWPRRVDDLSKRAPGHHCTSQEFGLHNDRPDSSPVCKPGGGYAHSDGPAPDYAMELARPVPVGTKRRLGPLRTDK